MKLENYLDILPEECVLLSHNDELYRSEDIICLAKELRNKYSFQSTDIVLLEDLNAVELVTAIIALDGYVSKLIICSSNELSVSSEYSMKLTAGLVSLRLSSAAYSVLTETEWVIYTSGTTGSPKRVFHTLKTLTQTCSSFCKSGKKYIWCLLYETTRFAGLQVILQSLVSGCILYIPSDFSFESILKCILKNKPNSISCTPSFLRKLLLSKDFHEMSFLQITLGGEIVDDSIMNTINIYFPSARVVHIYASTEAGVGFSVKDKQPGFPSAWLNNHKLSPLPMKISMNSTLLVKPAYMATGSEIKNRLDENDYLDTQDSVYIKNDRVFFAGRSNGMINIGGNKVFPEEIEKVLRVFPNIIEAKVYARESSIIGQLLAADIVLDETFNNNGIIKKIKLFCSRKLPHYKVPSFISLVSEMKLTDTGKLERI